MMWTVNERRHIRSITTVVRPLFAHFARTDENLVQDSFSMEVLTSSKPVEHIVVRPAVRDPLYALLD